MPIDILQILYITLTIFTIIIGTLLTIILLRVIKLLDVVEDLANTYLKVKGALSYYSNFNNIKNFALSFFKK